MDIKRHEKTYKRICKNIARLRRDREYTQETFADKIGISYSYYAQIEAPNVFVGISLPVLLDIANALEVNIKDLFEGC